MGGTVLIFYKKLLVVIFDRNLNYIRKIEIKKFNEFKEIIIFKNLNYQYTRKINSMNLRK